MKYLVFVLITLVLAAVFILKTRTTQKDNDIVVRQIEPMDSEILEEWERVTDDKDLLGVYATKTMHPKWMWQVDIAVAEFVREESLESELVNRITSSLTRVEGVKAVAHEDREVWIIEGDPNGEALVRAAASVLDALEPSLRTISTSRRDDELGG